MKKFLSYALTAAISFSAVFYPAPVLAQEKFSLKADEIADVLVSNYGVTSIQYSLMDQGSIILSDSWGIDGAVAEDTMYGIGSVSKMYTAAAVMQLADRGSLDIDMPLITYIEDFKMDDGRYVDITPRMLLNHSSGIYGTNFKNSFTFNEYDSTAHDMLLSNLATEKLKADPGAFSVYCNDGFTLLEILVERVSGLSFSEYFNQNFSSPLGLNNTKTSVDTFDQTQLAEAYFYTYEESLPRDSVNIIGTGGFYATAEDMCHFAQVLMGEKPDILSVVAVEAMAGEEYRSGLWLEADENFFSYGLGWDSVHTPPFAAYNIQALAKGGDSIFYHSDLIVLPEYGIAMAVSSSGGSSIFNNIFAATVLQHYLTEKGVIAEIIPETVFQAPKKVAMPDEMKAYEGIYAVTLGNNFEISINDGVVNVNDALGLSVDNEYLYTGGGKFTRIDGMSVLSFTELENGEIYAEVDTSVVIPGVGQTKMVYLAGQKIEPVSLPEDVLDSWRQRQGYQYYLLDESPVSQLHLAPLINFVFNEDIETGYTLGCRIIDKNYGESALQIPVMSGRDASDIYFFVEDGIEYLSLKGYTMLSEKYIQPFDVKTASVTIGDDGYAQWFSVDSTADMKEFIFEIPESASVAVYNEQFCYYFSPVTVERSAVLSQNGMIAFMGNPGDVITITLSK